MQFGVGCLLMVVLVVVILVIVVGCWTTVIMNDELVGQWLVSVIAVLLCP